MNAQELKERTKQFADWGAHAPSRACFGALAGTSGERRLAACSSRQLAANILRLSHCVVRLALNPRRYAWLSGWQPDRTGWQPVLPKQRTAFPNQQLRREVASTRRISVSAISNQQYDEHEID